MGDFTGLVIKSLEEGRGRGGLRGPDYHHLLFAYEYRSEYSIDSPPILGSDSE